MGRARAHSATPFEGPSNLLKESACGARCFSRSFMALCDEEERHDSGISLHFKQDVIIKNGDWF
jgi:hypothetical protein